MLAELHLEINCLSLHLMGQPYCKKSRSAKVKDGIITYFLGTISLDDTLVNTRRSTVMSLSLQ
jgi:hypothetical protein